ncbi:2-oxo acid dehydrogenase subunit E2 [Streptomonospora sp. S1-112]|uniref:Dihydrolipoamide acetyltransferase component of pyruvate dehydrogenase complex n=1 Tax=Streptomonospora mangrovi TaxID=2883123 RepID=A0A9X3SFR7_9ACTN|nr:dihydrolipoamide acetyltransferase family protein [Streptomonospora mangrovi]MDA0566232.1 2-oxo acid dehydrogenase subunit E2 [Streptomonospora mangrovi]
MSAAEPGGVRAFLLPDLGEGLADAEILAWLVEVGDEVAVDQPVAEVETAKTTVEVPCPYAGRVTALHGAPGEAVPVGAPLISVDTGRTEAGGGPAAGPAPAARAAEGGTDGDGTDAGGAPVPAAGAAGAPSPAAPSPERPTAAERVLASLRALPADRGAADTPGGPAPAPESAPPGADGSAPLSGAVLVGYGTRAEQRPSPSRRRPQRRDPAEGGPRPTASAAPPPPPAAGAAGGAPHPVPVVSPLVRRIAREHGIDVAALVGSGEGGLVLRRDVEAAVAARRAGTAPAAPAPPPAAAAAVPAARPEADPVSPPAQPAPAAAPAGARRVPLSGPHREMARRMARSRREIPEATVWVDVDATGLLDLRAALTAADPDRPVGLLALLARFCVLGLRRFPALNSRFDAERGELVEPPGVHLGFAAQTPRGLVVPVVRDAHALTTRELAGELTALTERARGGSLPPDRLTGGTFTVNNYGVFGVDGAAAVINHPESAIVGVGRIVKRPWVVGDDLAVRPVTELTLAFDHRVCDGAVAAGFLRFVADCVERPELLIGDM